MYFAIKNHDRLYEFWDYIIWHNVGTDMVYLQINAWAFPYWPGYHPETPILARDAVEGQYGSRDDNQANMQMPMY